jgi:hypothetical protein
VIDLVQLTDATVTTLRSIPELVTALERPENITGYVDLNPDRNSVSKAIYQMPPGSVLVVWQETLFAASSTEGWNHRFQIFVRARRGESSLNLLRLLVNGVPNPGDGLCWRFCPVMSGVLPTEIPEITRMADEEGIDYFAITAETQEVGDQGV